jgi:hypothetical protein
MLANVVGLSLLVMFDEEAEDKILGVAIFTQKRPARGSFLCVPFILLSYRKPWSKGLDETEDI